MDKCIQLRIHYYRQNTEWFGYLKHCICFGFLLPHLGVEFTRYTSYVIAHPWHSAFNSSTRPKVGSGASGCPGWPTDHWKHISLRFTYTYIHASDALFLANDTHTLCHISDHFFVYIPQNGRIKSQDKHECAVFRMPPGCPRERLCQSTLSPGAYETLSQCGLRIAKGSK